MNAMSLICNLYRTNLRARIDAFSAEANAFRRELSQMKITISKQNKSIINIINEQQITLKALLRRKSDIDTGGNRAKTTATASSTASNSTSNQLKEDLDLLFPIRTQKELDDIESLIDESNRKEMIKVIGARLYPDGIRKNLLEILSIKLLVEYNMEGHSNKRRLLHYEKLLHVLYKAQNNHDINFHGFIHELRSTMKRFRNHHYKLLYAQRHRHRRREERCYGIQTTASTTTTTQKHTTTTDKFRKSNC